MSIECNDASWLSQVFNEVNELDPLLLSHAIRIVQAKRDEAEKDAEMCASLIEQGAFE